MHLFRRGDFTEYTVMTNKKTRRAVLVSIEQEDGRIRIRLDDVEGEEGSKNWVRKEHVTNKTYDENVVREMAIDEAEFADFGMYIFARLSAFLSMGEC
ncbi:hypothetical protein GCM10007863_22800 [Dyella mobilis]|nr:hypothetical protein GCM10007863_22800 [Dyella mobilis]